MKKYSYIKILFIFGIIGVLASCNPDENLSLGDPVITGIKRTVLDKEFIDGAEFGDWLIISGHNFSQVKQVIFNDVEVKDGDMYIEPDLISLKVPRKLPTQNTDVVKLITSSGVVVSRTFSLVIPLLQIDGLYNEYASPGDTVKVMGKNFDIYEINSVNSKVQFADTLIKVVNATENYFRFVVPTHNYQNAKMRLISEGVRPVNMVIPGRFRDNRNVIFNFDYDKNPGWFTCEFTNGIGKMGYPDSISGNYAVFKGRYEGWSGNYAYGTDTPLNTALQEGTASQLAGSTDNKVAKFEINVREEWYANRMAFAIFTDYFYYYEPYKQFGSFKTDGWMTVTIPLSEFKKKIGDEYFPITEITPHSVQDWQWGYQRKCQMEGDVKVGSMFICWDNFRIVEKD